MSIATWAPLAEIDLEEIVYYVALEQRRLQAADEIANGVRAACEPYARNPWMGEACPRLGRNLRRFTHKRWVVVYRPSDTGIEVIGVVDGSRDYSSYFRGR